MIKESVFQANLKRLLKTLFPNSIILKTDASQVQGIPDLLILFAKRPGESLGRWAALECKRDISASHRPNQDTWVETMNNMSFARFIYPQNKKEVLHDLEQAYKS